jgi:hypothetical protein
VKVTASRCRKKVPHERGRREGLGAPPGTALGPADDGRRPAAPAELAGDGDLQHPAAGDDPYPVGQLFGLVEVVGGEQHRRAEGAQLPDERPELPPRLGVEPGGRLVEEQQLRAADDAQSDLQPSALPTRQPASAGAGVVGEADEFEHLVDVAWFRVVRRLRAQQLPAGQLALAQAGLEHDAQLHLPAPPAGRRVHAEHPDLSAVAVPETLQHLDGGRLAGTVGTQQREGLPPPDVQVDPVDGGAVPVPLHQAADRDGGVPVERPGGGRRGRQRRRGGAGHGRPVSSTLLWPPAGSRRGPAGGGGRGPVLTR